MEDSLEGFYLWTKKIIEDFAAINARIYKRFIFKTCGGIPSGIRERITEENFQMQSWKVFEKKMGEYLEKIFENFGKESLAEVIRQFLEVWSSWYCFQGDISERIHGRTSETVLARFSSSFKKFWRTSLADFILISKNSISPEKKF